MSGQARVLLGMVLIVIGLIGLTIAAAPKADARVVFLGGEYQTASYNPVIWHEHVQGKWHYVELYSGAEWLVTRCRTEDSRNCWWNAKTRDNCKGRSFVNIAGQRHFVDYRMQP